VTYLVSCRHLGSLNLLVGNQPVYPGSTSYPVWEQWFVSDSRQVPSPSWHTTLSRASTRSWSSCKSCENRGSDTIARFLSPDPYVQLPNNTQSYNRYSYCMNNPLNLVDLTGEMFDWIYNKENDF
ncbi:MAG: hypothetical protein LBR51_02630, partial [Bacteroidales bacterium]|nr:hypothetical protein [Bacteroidales bacterium]